MKTNGAVLEARVLTKIFHRGSESVVAVNGVSLAVAKGDFLAVTGPSGSGKTTLINILGCLDNATSGTLALDGQTVFDGGRTLSEHELTLIRRRIFGYIFQKFYLVSTLTVLENVSLPFAFYRKKGQGRSPEDLLALLGLGNRMRHRPGQLSGGEMQRVAIARALVNSPEILIADEPTGNLDSARSMEIGETLRALNEREGLTIILVTHNPALAAIARRTVELRDGRIFSETSAR